MAAFKLNCLRDENKFTSPISGRDRVPLRELIHHVSRIDYAEF